MPDGNSEHLRTLERRAAELRDEIERLWREVHLETESVDGALSMISEGGGLSDDESVFAERLAWQARRWLDISSRAEELGRLIEQIEAVWRERGKEGA